MSKMSELSMVLDALIECGNNLTQAAEQLRSYYSADELPKEEPKTAEPQKTATLEEVRAVLAEKSRAGKTAAVKELLQKYGAEKLSEVDAANYAALLTDAEVI